MMGNTRPPKENQKVSPIGPRDKPELADPATTLGTGMLLEEDEPEVEEPTG